MRRLNREVRIEMIVDERRCQRQNRALDPIALHTLNLLRHVEKRSVKAKMHAADIKIDRIPLASLDLDRKFILRLDKFEKRLRYKVTVDIGNHHLGPR